MFGPLDELFDFNRDGKLDTWEQAAEFQFMEDMLEKDRGGYDDDDDDYDSSDYSDFGYDD